MISILTTKDLAKRFHTDDRRLRRFLRSRKSGVGKVGKGNRYLINPSDLGNLRRRFDLWDKEYARR